MREINVKLYKYDELTEEVKQRVIEEWRNSWDENDSDLVNESIKNTLEAMFLPADNVQWSLSYSQGDGVAFYGLIENENMFKIVNYFYENKLIDKDEFKLYERIYKEDYTLTFEIVKNSYGHHYSHWNTMALEREYDSIDIMVEDIFSHEIEENEKNLEKHLQSLMELYNKLENLTLKYIQNNSKELEKQGYEEIEYIESRENIEEIIKNNEYEFYENGEMY